MSTKYYYREWLNLHGEGTAFIQAEGGQLKIGDCAKIITLDFWLEDDSSKKEIANLEYKIDTLYKAVQDYRRHVKKELKKVQKLQQREIDEQE